MNSSCLVPVWILAAIVALFATPTLAQPVPSVSDTLLDFGDVHFSSSDVIPFWIRNTGNANLISIVSSSDPARFAISTTIVQVLPGDSAQVDVTFTPTLPGSYAEVITVSNFNAVPDTILVDVIGNGAVLSPGISVTPPQFTVAMNENEITTRNLYIENTGGQTLTWNASAQPSWLSVIPSSGSNGPGIVTEVTVTFDSDATIPGSYFGSILVTSNADPDSITVLATMNVSGQPEIDVVPTSLSFGKVYQGFSLDETFTIYNVGTRELNVSSLVVGGNSDFTVDTGPFVLPQNQSQVVTVTLTPTGNGPVTGSVQINSDDLDEPVVTVLLDGEESSLSPPVLSVSTDTLSASLSTGQMTTVELPISNPGGDDLVWFLETVEPTGQPLSGLRVLVDHSHEASGFFTDSSIFINTVTADGVVWTVNTAPITLGVLVNYDVLYVPSQLSGSGWTQAEADAVRDFVQGGGALLIDARYTIAVTNANLLMATLGTGINFRFGSAFSGLSTLINPSKITAGVDKLQLVRGSEIFPLFQPGVAIAWYRSGGSHLESAYAKVGHGRVIGAGDPFHRDDRVTVFEADNLLFATQALEWLGSTTPGLSVNTTGDTLAAGATDTITVTFDASVLASGSYFSNLSFTSNDPLTQSAVVPTVLHVAGTSVIAASDTAVTFDHRIVGTSQVKSISIRNLGLSPLNVTDILDPDSVFTSVADAGSPPFVLASGDTTGINITFLPLSPGPHAGVLRIVNSSANADTLSIALFGNGADAVNLVVVPDSVHVSMAPDTTRSAALSITNNGSRDEVLLGAVHETTGGASVPNVYFDNFEDGDFAGWNVVTTSGTKEVLGTGGAEGSIFNYRESNAQQGHSDGIYQVFPGGIQPSEMGFWIRPDQDNLFGSYVTIHDGAGREAIFLFAMSSGVFYLNANVGGSLAWQYNAGEWYHVEYRDIDWVAKNFDYVVNDSLVQADISFRNAADVNEFTRIDLYHFDTGASGSWDNVWIDYSVPPAWLGVSPLSTTLMSDSTAQYQLDFDSNGLSFGSYSALMSVASNDPVNPLRIIPVTLGVDSVVTSVDPLSFRPRTFALFQNYPNPFNPSTTIAFDLPQAAVARVEVYNVRGQMVRSIDAGRRPAGRHTIDWNGRDAAGQAVASGVYFYRLIAGPYVQTRKMLLLK